MPNTLAHLGVQAVATRGLLRDADRKWIYLGCILPDVPWILRRALHAVSLPADPFTLHFYAFVQSSLAGCLLLGAALAAFSAAPRRVFLILSANSLFHLLLDALQRKWANGVHLFAPFSWELWNAGLFWPESWPTYVLTAFGLAYVVATWRRRREGAMGISGRRWPVGAALLAAYVVVPAAFLEGPEGADVQSLRTLRDRGARPGNEVGFDRREVVPRAGRVVVEALGGEEIALRGLDGPAEGGTVSLRGRFADASTIEVREAHWHDAWDRDLGSYGGLALIVLIWADWFARRRRGPPPGDARAPGQAPPGNPSGTRAMA